MLDLTNVLYKSPDYDPNIRIFSGFFDVFGSSECVGRFPNPYFDDNFWKNSSQKCFPLQNYTKIS